MTKLKLSFADTHNDIASFFVSILSQRYEIQIDHTNPDLLIFGDENFGQTNKKIKRGEGVTKVFYTGENCRPENYDCDYAISFDHVYNPWHFRLPLFVIYMWAFNAIHKLGYGYDYLFNQDLPVREKTGFASFVVSNPNCKQRNDFFHLMNKIAKVDSGGKLFNNAGEVKGEQGKIDFLSQRKFNICFEPYSHPGYVTEKILHAFYAKTVPIYWGSDTIEYDFNPNAFINVNRFKTFDHAIEYVQLVHENKDMYETIVSQPAFMYNIPKSYILADNLLNWFDAVINKRIAART